MELPADLELGPKMQACSDRERKFVWTYVLAAADGRVNGAQAARDAGISDVADGAKVRAHELLHRERVLEAIEEVSRKHFRSLLVPAIVAVRQMLTNADHPDHMRTAMSVLSRLGFVEKTGVDVNVTGEVTLNHTDRALEDLRILQALGTPREKLVETFGESGLGRYEKMLAEREPRRLSTDVVRGAVIEGEVVSRETE